MIITDTDTTYRIVRFHRDGEPETIATDLSLDEAREHCNDPAS